MKGQKLYGEFKTKMQKIADLQFASALMEWDQEIYLPSKGAEIRGRQIATLSELSHEMFTAPAMKKLLTSLSKTKDLNTDEKKNVALSFRDISRKTKLPASFVRELSETSNRCFHSWIKARKENDFSVFRPDLKKMIILKRQEASLLGYERNPYDALLDEYDPGMTVSKLDRIFKKLIPELSSLLDKVLQQQKQDDKILNLHYSEKKQWDLGIELLKRIGFDFEAGRQDLSEHPFTVHLNARDVRLTTRIDSSDLANMTWSCLHEGGHGLYEQGLSMDQYGLPLGQACSLSIHESQSRFWENCLGRSLAFWKWNMPLLRKIFPHQMKGISANDFFRMINRVSPSLIRTEADELTYHFHVLIRYEIEKKLIQGEMETGEIPEYWNQLYEKYLGVKVPDDKQGCLQDVHWSHGSFGYFPTYSLGSLYAAQFYLEMNKKKRSLDKMIETGNLQYIQTWMQENIYRHGRRFSSEQLCKKACGKGLDPKDLIIYLSRKYNSLA